jgi:hypothetical protein
MLEGCPQISRTLRGGMNQNRGRNEAKRWRKVQPEQIKKHYLWKVNLSADGGQLAQNLVDMLMDGKSWVRYLRIDWSHVEIGVITKEIEQFQNDVPKEKEIDRSIYLDRPIELISKKFQNVFEQVERDRSLDRPIDLMWVVFQKVQNIYI